MNNFTLLKTSRLLVKNVGPWAIVALLCFAAWSTIYAQDIDVDKYLKLKDIPRPAPGEVPNTVNPFLSLTPPGTPTQPLSWMMYKKAQKDAAVQSENYVNRSLTIDEVEPNNTIGQGQKLNFFGSRYSQFNQVFVDGSSGMLPAFNSRAVDASENNGSIHLADETGLDEMFEQVVIQSEIGDGPNAGISDWDFYKVEARAGMRLIVDINTPIPFGDLDSYVVIYDANGNSLAESGEDATSYDSFINFVVPQTGTYYICVGGYFAFIPIDPFDEDSPSVTGAIGSEGEYELVMSLFNFTDTDYYLVNLRRGDVFGADLVGAGFGARLSIFNFRGELNVSTNLPSNANYPSPNPLPANGETSVAFIAPEHGWYAVNVSENFGDYLLEMFVTRPAGEVNAPMEQVIFLDYNGEDFDPCEFLEIPTCSFPTFLTPLKEFFPAWGLPNDDATVRRITARITDVVKESLETDLKRSGLNRFFRVRIIGNNGLTDRTGSYEPRSVGFRQVSRVITSGTTAEALINTIGIAQSIDLGNFRQEEDAIVLLDVLSAPATPGANANFTFSLNDVVLAPGVSKEDLVVTVLGNVIAHEAGHYLGNWHNDGFSATKCIMDEGPGGLFNLAGIGASGVFGGPDQVDVDFVTDTYSFRELFTGTENTQVNTAFALTLYPFRTYLEQINEELLDTDRRQDMLQLSKTYPNPAKVNDEIMMGFTMEKEGPATVRLFDMSGKAISTLYSNDRAATGIVHQLRLNSAELNLSAGTYIYALETTQGVVSKKLVLTK